MSEPDYITRQNIRYSDHHKIRNVFFESLCAAEQHWFFVQGHDAYTHELYLPAVSSLLNGIEATLRVTLHMLGLQAGDDIRDISPYRVLSNTLINQAREAGMPVRYLAFEGEADFNEKLASQKPNKKDVEIVRLRNNICHGNVMDFVNVELGSDMSFFTPESLKMVTEHLLPLSLDWCIMLGKFRREKGFNNYDAPTDAQRARDLVLYDFVQSRHPPD